MCEVGDRHGGRGLRRRDPRAAGLPRRSSTCRTPRCQRRRSRHAVTGTSASKAWNLPGLACGQLILRERRRPRGVRACRRRATHGTSPLGVIAAAAAYTEGGPWLDGVLAHLDGNRRALATLLAEHLPTRASTARKAPTGPWLDRAPSGSVTARTRCCARAPACAAIDGARCGTARPAGSARLNFATAATGDRAAGTPAGATLSDHASADPLTDVHARDPRSWRGRHRGVAVRAREGGR